MERLDSFEKNSAAGLNGAMVLIHPGTDPARTDKLYLRLGELIDFYTGKGYTFKKL
jgi:peptidoglycan/xylan/chitin deacetylase (PgdA/CDA1 family)